MAILPFDNLTASPDVQQELFDALHKELRRRLGVRDAPEQKADAIVRGTITDYQSDIPQAYSAQATSATRRLEITVDIEIVDQASGKVLFQQKGMKTDADYAERAEADGRKKAISQLVDKVVEGAQSQW
ncbi:MAG TPA: LPS assembly lipoprotein LptE [Gemmatimonadaceae bacterium]|nr:LPS assembly lipoprotein LptE [Gemmatimonadaceae bacterium]